MDFFSLITLEAILVEVFWENTSLISLSLPLVWIRMRMIFSQRITILKQMLTLQKFVTGRIGKSM